MSEKELISSDYVFHVTGNMTTLQQERIKNWQLHPSIRGQFAFELYKAMADDERIWCLTADLGWMMLDKIRDDFPDRFLNVGASEQLLIGAGVGLALSGKIPFCYSITTFLLFRPAEWIRNYVNHEQIPVRLIGSGINNDYSHDGFTHQPDELKDIDNYFDLFRNIETYFPLRKEIVPDSVRSMIENNKPSFMCLRR